MVPGSQSLIFSPKLATRRAVRVHVAYFLKNCGLGGRPGPQNGPKKPLFGELRFPEVYLRKSAPRKCDLHMIPHLLVFFLASERPFFNFRPPKNGLFFHNFGLRVLVFSKQPPGEDKFFQNVSKSKKKHTTGCRIIDNLFLEKKRGLNSPHSIKFSPLNKNSPLSNSLWGPGSGLAPGWLGPKS